MKPIALIILALVLVVGTYLNNLDPDKTSQTVSNETFIEDSVGTSMAAPVQR